MEATDSAKLDYALAHPELRLLRAMSIWRLIAACALILAILSLMLPGRSTVAWLFVLAGTAVASIAIALTLSYMTRAAEMAVGRDYARSRLILALVLLPLGCISALYVPFTVEWTISDRQRMANRPRV